MIGIFDSGLGGLTVLKKLLIKLPDYDYCYLGDCARTPYGNKSQPTIYQYTKQAVDYLFKKNCQLIIIACNTSSAKALRKIQQEFLPKHYPDKRVLGVLRPAVEKTIEEWEKTKDEKKAIGIIGTKSTINSGAYVQEIKKIKKNLTIYSQACPLLVPIIEENWQKKPEAKMILKKYLRPLKNKKVSILILGCTHYPFLQKDINKIMGKKTVLINTPEAVAEKLTDYLKRHPEIEKKITRNKRRYFYTTDDLENFKKLGENFLLEKITNIEKINLK